MKTVGIILLVMISVPVLAGLFLLMPAEFAVSSWQLTRIDAQATGYVVESGVLHNRANSRSKIRYSFEANGESFSSENLRPGLFSGAAYESGGGDLARSLKPGDAVTVYYSSRNPGRSVLEYGWPKWSIGFSLIAWGLVFSQWDSWRRRMAAYAMSRSMTTVGFATIILFHPTVTPHELRWLAAIVALSLIGWSVWWNRRIKKELESEMHLVSVRGRFTF